MTDYSKASHTAVEVPDITTLDTFPANGHQPVVEWNYPEFQSLCPVSGRHDQGNLTIRYKPKQAILESKSVRDYLMKWRNLKNWQEYITDEISDLLYRSCEPEWLMVTIQWSSRGGIVARTISERGNIPSLK